MSEPIKPANPAPPSDAKTRAIGTESESFDGGGIVYSGALSDGAGVNVGRRVFVGNIVN